ncbi:Uu.00g012780.m01.CDS01 [Anthostomella pinea]|uniref:Uu.00g012780.m01.CDS01 n=1 Tax=Anthostomella pinea TaxID=933095 RepID=A0AAI8YQ44_9PEZI|nr:Uu.00g012780.m01.CDS01 [Anthostomella pinea]
MAAFKLLDLPLAIVVEVCACLVSNCDESQHQIFDDLNVADASLAGMVSLSRSCKVLHAVASPLLVQIGSMTRWMSCRDYFPLLPYTIRILEDPILARRETTFRASRMPRFPLPQPEQLVKKLGYEDVAAYLSWAPDEQSGYCTFQKVPATLLLIQLVLPTLPKLASVSLFGLDRFHVLEPRSSLSLKSIVYGPSGGYGGGLFPLDPFDVYPENPVGQTNYSDIGGLKEVYHAAPHLEHLTVICGVVCMEEMKLANLRSLVLHSNILTRPCLKNLFPDGLRYLEHFAYSSEPHGILREPSSPGTYRGATPGEIVRALAPSMSSLRTLELCITEPIWYFEAEEKNFSIA